MYELKKLIDYQKSKLNELEDQRGIFNRICNSLRENMIARAAMEAHGELIKINRTIEELEESIYSLSNRIEKEQSNV